MATKDVVVDILHKELFVVDDASNEIDIYKLDDDGTPTAKLRCISGSATQLNGPSGLSINMLRDEIYVVNGTDAKLLVFDREADGNVTPLRNIALL